MYKFMAYRLGNKTVINENHHYKSGEILNFYLNYDFSKLHEKYLKCLKNKRRVLFPLAEISYDYNAVVYKVQNFFTYVDSLITELPPFDKIITDEKRKSLELLKLLSKYQYLFNYEDEEYNEDILKELVPYGDEFGEYDDENIDTLDYYENRYKQEDDEIIEEFVIDFFNSDAEPVIVELNKRIEILFNSYMNLVIDILRVPNLYANFLNNYVHNGVNLQNPTEIAKAYMKYDEHLNDRLKQNKNILPYEKFEVAHNVSIYHGILDVIDDNGETKPMIWQVYEYKGIGGFLYNELFEGLQTGLLPKRCHNCGKYFLLTSGYNTDFCDNTAPNEEVKTCRDIGARKKYDDKVRNDPVWLAYQRAYKAHYARVLKKKMSKADFTVWADYAIELRTKALSGEMEFEEYERILKK